MLGSVCLRASMTLLRKKAKLEEVLNCDAGALLMGLEYFFDTVHSSIYIDLLELKDMQNLTSLLS